MPDGEYQPQSAFEGAVLENLRGIRSAMEENRERIEKLEEQQRRQTALNTRFQPAIRLYERLVPLGVDRWLPIMLDTAARSTVFKGVRGRVLAIAAFLLVMVPPWIGLILILVRHT